MKNLILLLIVFLITGLTINTSGQTSPDYIFGDGWGSGWSWTTGTAGTASLGNTYKWQFLSTETQSHYFKFGETASPSNGQGFWMNNSGSGLEYTGNGAMWSAYYYANMEPNGAIFFANEVGNYYVVKTRKDPGNSNCNFAVFDNGAQAPVTVSSVTRTFSSPNLLINSTLSGVKSANEKIWVRYTTDNWITSNTIEASNNTSGNIWQASVALTSGQLVKYYVYTTIQQTVAPAEAEADFFTINYNNNSGVNYTYMNGNMTGTYYIGNNGTRPGGGNPDFSFLAQACDAINSSTIAGNCTFYFTSNTTEPLNVGLGVNTNGHSVTFKPSADENRTITFTQAGDNGGPSGGFLLGMTNPNDWATQVTTENIVIDGYSDGGSTRRLTLTNLSTAHRYTFPLVIQGNSNNIQIKNCKIIHQATGSTGTSSQYAFVIRARVDASSTQFIPDDILLENCEITNTTTSITGHGIAIYNSVATGGTQSQFPSGVIIKGNIIVARTRGIFLNYSGNTTIRDNTISVNQNGNGSLSQGIYVYLMGNNTRVTDIYNNKIIQLSTANSTSGDYGIVGILIGSQGITNVYNNTIGGFATTTVVANPSCVIDGIRVATATVNGITANIYNNSVVIPDLNITPGSGIVTVRAFYLNYSGSSGTRVANVQNNIFYLNETNFITYAYYWSNTTLATLTSNYNNLFVSANGKIGRFGVADCNLLSDWKGTSGKDANSVSKQSYYFSSTDLHLTGNSVGDFDLAGTPLESVTTDIDEQTRSTTYPYMGADENLNVPLTPYKRNINGDFTDWTGTPSGTAHATVVSNQEAIYKGEGGDARTDQHGAVDDNWKNNDITDFRFTRDNSFIYFGIKMNDITDINRPYIAITIDKDQIDDTPLWIGANSGVSLAPGNNRGWERQIALHAISNGVLGIQLFADDGASWYNPLSNYSISGSADNDVIEAKIALYDLGLTPGSTLRLSVASFNNNLAPFAEEVYSYIDIVTPGYSGTSNAWFRGGENTSTLNANVQWDQSITPLPVELAGFTALPSGQKIDLKWSTKTEVNSYKFVVERSLKTEDGSQNALWEAVGEVNASGNSNSPKEYSFSDKNLADGKYSYRLKMIDNDGTFEYSPVVEVEVEVPNTFALSQNYPNPFNPVTQIRYQLPVNSQVKLMIFSITGELVTTLVDENQPAGNYTVPFDASALASGTYIYRLVAGDFVSTKKMVVLK